MALREKTVIITGVGQALPRAIAIAFAKENYNVVLADPDYIKSGNVANDIAGTGGETLSVKCDVTKKEEVDDMITKAISRYKKIDVLVYGGEIATPKSFMNITITDWEGMMSVNLRGALLVSQSVLKEMKEKGKIVFLSSIASTVAWNEMSNYSASKGGLDAMMRAMAVELAPKNINVNSVVAGVIDTPETSMTVKNEASEKMDTVNPDRRIGKPEDVAGAAVFLASDKADFITGQSIVVDGGYTLR
ncbi:MAG: SDR family oxidoreductase [Candidatus Paceibacterota bacterium]|jgi:NAD(P)-dependent dehydrogenase (short-subunit alcohol dehydrogenase family)|nr:SDR family oxidoreductase [Candidatus Paceibacterota bacterium]